MGDIDLRVISATENWNKFQKTRFWKEKSVVDMTTLGPTGTGHTSMLSKVTSRYRAKFLAGHYKKQNEFCCKKSFCRCFIFKKCVPLAEDKFHLVRCPPTTLTKKSTLWKSTLSFTQFSPTRALHVVITRCCFASVILSGNNFG